MTVATGHGLSFALLVLVPVLFGVARHGHGVLVAALFTLFFAVYLLLWTSVVAVGFVRCSCGARALRGGGSPNDGVCPGFRALSLVHAGRAGGFVGTHRSSRRARACSSVAVSRARCAVGWARNVWERSCFSGCLSRLAALAAKASTVWLAREWEPITRRPALGDASIDAWEGTWGLYNACYRMARRHAPALILAAPGFLLFFLLAPEFLPGDLSGLRAPVLALSGWALAITAPAVSGAVARRERRALLLWLEHAPDLEPLLRATALVSFRQLAPLVFAPLLLVRLGDVCSSRWLRRWCLGSRWARGCGRRRLPYFSVLILRPITFGPERDPCVCGDGNGAARRGGAAVVCLRSLASHGALFGGVLLVCLGAGARGARTLALAVRSRGRPLPGCARVACASSAWYRLARTVSLESCAGLGAVPGLCCWRCGPLEPAAALVFGAGNLRFVRVGSASVGVVGMASGSRASSDCAAFVVGSSPRARGRAHAGIYRWFMALSTAVLSVVEVLPAPLVEGLHDAPVFVQAVLIVLAAVVVPLAEEGLFRGWLTVALDFELSPRARWLAAPCASVLCMVQQPRAV